MHTQPACIQKCCCCFCWCSSTCHHRSESIKNSCFLSPVDDQQRQLLSATQDHWFWSSSLRKENVHKIAMQVQLFEIYNHKVLRGTSLELKRSLGTSVRNKYNRSPSSLSSASSLVARRSPSNRSHGMYLPVTVLRASATQMGPIILLTSCCCCPPSIFDCSPSLGVFRVQHQPHLGWH